jgi:hypothetical protein
MAIELEHRFGRDSRVRDYWLAASEGFAVESADGRSVGTVRQVVRERDGRAAALVVEARHGLVGTDEVILEAEAVEEVAPWRSTLVVPSREVPVPETGTRLPALRGALAARARAALQLALTVARRDVAHARARWPAVKARFLQGWAWSVAVALGLVGAAAALARALAARLAAAVSASRSP